MHYYKFNIGDWHLHTSHLTLVEEAVYFRLVNHYYNTEKPFIKSETQTLIRRLRLGNESVTVKAILEEFFVLNGENYVHARCEKEIKTFKKKAKVNKENGAKGGRPPVSKGLEDNPEETQTVTTLNPNVTLNTNHKPLTTNQEPLLKDIVANAPVEQNKAKRFTPPTVQEVSQQMESKGLPLNEADKEADKFVNFYESKGWMVGRNKMKVWKASVNTWLSNYKPAQSPNQPESTGWSEVMNNPNHLEG